MSTHLRPAALLLALVLALAACGSESTTATATPTAVPTAQPSAQPTAESDDETGEGQAVDEETASDGAWLLDGYGQMLVLEGNELVAVWVPAGDWCTEITELPPIFDLALDGPDRGVIDLGKTFDMVRVELPPNCVEPERPVPARAVIDGFIDVMDRQYPFFVERDIDWETAKQDLLVAAADATDSDEAATAIANFIATMNDSHMFIDAQPSEAAPSTPPDMTIAESFVADLRLETYLGDTTLELADGAILFGELLPTVGYLQINRMAGYGDTEPEDLANYTELLTTALTELKGYDKLIIDLRGNGGGSDELSHETISRFIDEPFDLYTKEAYNTPSTFQTISVEPSSAVHFDGEVVVLVGANTASAAEILGTGMHRIGATVIGTRSEGIFSDINPLVLPGGFDFGMSNEVYRDLDGLTYEVRRVPRTVETTAAQTFDAAFTAAEIETFPPVELPTDEELLAATTGAGALDTLYGDVCEQIIVEEAREAADQADDICAEIFDRAIERNGKEIVDQFIDGSADPQDVLLPVLEEVLQELFE